MSARLEASDGRTAIAVVTVVGYSFSGIEHDFYGVYVSEKEAEKSFQSKGYVLVGMGDNHDTRRAISDKEILEAWCD